MLTETQRIQRKNRIGSSDAAAICGLDPYRTPVDVWATLTGRVPPFVGNKATLAGTFMERGILDWFEVESDRTLQRDVFVEHADGVRACNLDGLTIGTPEIVEAKTCGILFPAKMRDEYGDPADGIEGVPQHVIIQTHHQAAVIEPVYGRVNAINVVALIGMRGFVHYRFDVDWALAGAVAERVQQFHANHVATDTQPDGAISPDVAKKFRRTAGKTVPIDAELVSEWQRNDQIAKEVAKTADELKQQVIAALGDAEAGTSSAGGVTFKETTRKGYVVNSTTCRTLRFQKPR